MLGSDSMRSDSTELEAFPTFYRREDHGRHAEFKEKDKVEYPPMPEDKKLGVISTAALIVTKMIGTGVFAKPTTVLANSGGKAASLGLWVACGVMSLFGILNYVELGVAMPFSGAEVVYVQACYPRPKYLVVVVISLLYVLLEHHVGNCFGFASLVMRAYRPSEQHPNFNLQRVIAFAMFTGVSLIHLYSRKTGIFINNLLAAYKVLTLVTIVLTGFAVMVGFRPRGLALGDNRYGARNFANATQTERKTLNEYSNAILGVLWAYTGWSNANFVLGEVSRPRGKESSVFKTAAFSSLGIVTILYVLANVAYYAVLTDEEIVHEGEAVVTRFFVKVFGDASGDVTARVVNITISLSVLGNFISTTFTLARVKQEIAKLRILPFSKFWASQSKWDTPQGALLLNWIVGTIYILAVPNSSNNTAYHLITDLFIYGEIVMIITCSVGLFIIRYPVRYLRLSTQVMIWPVLVTIVSIYVPLNVFVLVIAWLPSSAPDIPSFVIPGVTFGILAAGSIYWCIFAKIMPALGWHIDSEPDEMIDGSRVVTFKRYKTGFAEESSEWWHRRTDMLKWKKEG